MIPIDSNSTSLRRVLQNGGKTTSAESAETLDREKRTETIPRVDTKSSVVEIRLPTGAPHDLRSSELSSPPVLHEEDQNILLAFNRDWVIGAANARAEAVTGYARDQLLGRSLWHLVPLRSRLRLRKRCVVSTDRCADIEIHTRRGDLRVLHLSWYESGSSGSPTEYLATGRDITSQAIGARFEKTHQRVLEMLAADAPIREIIAFLSWLIGDEMGNAKCTITLDRGDASDGDGTLTEALSVADLLDSDAPRLRAAGECSHISVTRADEADGEFEWQWALPVRTGERISWITVLRRDSRPPDDHQTDLLLKAGGLLRLVLAHDQLTSHLRRQAHHDGLTGLPNRVYLRAQLAHAICEAKARDLIVGVLYIDLDDFKLVNDSAGHLYGDCVLACVAQRIRSKLDPAMLVARVGGDEFNVLVPNARSLQSIRDVAERVTRSLDEPFAVEGNELFVSATIGMAAFPHHGADAELVLKHADAALYRAKSVSRSQTLCYTPLIGRAASQKLAIQNQLRRAIERNELRVHYQPQISLRTNALAGVEALLRWMSPKLGTVPPAVFIPVAESSGMIIPIGQWLLDEVCRQGLEWVGERSAFERVALNVSTVQFQKAGFVDSVLNTLQHTGFDPRHLELELTESVIMHDVEESVRKIVILRELGVVISIDDFGSGYSSLNYLQQLPVDALKIDRTFIRRIRKGKPQPPLIRAIIDLAHNLGMAVTAEVETEYQLACLRELGCDKAQGNLFSRSANVADIKELIR
jgi:diguanylate cyclase (GGDEF)-like protein/PAS domain S-box-containing protein